jgi:hypothetical protein
LRPIRAATLLLLLLLPPFLPAPARAADAVGEWVAVIDRLDGGQMRRYTLSILFPAIHDALNAIQPRYSRWTPAAAGEPRGAGASPEAAIATVAHEVLTRLGQGRAADRDAPYAAALARVPEGPARDAGVALGRAVAVAALRRRELDGFAPYSSFSVSDRPWSWRPTPTDFQRDVVPTTAPLLFTPAAAAALVPPPPAFGSSTYRRDNDQVRGMGRRDQSGRTAYQTSAALFWANQVSHRGFMDAAVTLLEERRPADGLWGSARLLALISVAMDDAAVIIWQAKERYSVWRPVTAIQLGGGGVTPDPDWMPLINTPPFPEYPSGHATDCAAGAAVMTAFFGPATPFTYRSLGVLQTYSQRYPSFAEASHECAQSRIWAGVHWLNTEDVSETLGAAIGRQALTHLVPLVRPNPQGFSPMRSEQGRP